jgi:uncharacterized protein
LLEYRNLNAAELKLDKRESVKLSEINAAVTLQKSAIGIGADFKVRYHGEFTCVRCLRKFTQDGTAELHLDYVEGSDPHVHADNVELTAHEADRAYYRGTHIDLSLGIREAIILSQPIAYLCKDDCSGLCPVCGVDLNRVHCSCKAKKPGLFALDASKPDKVSAKKKRGASRK